MHSDSYFKFNRLYKHCFLTIWRNIIVLIVVLLFIFYKISYSHPHVLLTASLEFHFIDKKCNGFWVEWIFDDIFGTSVIQEFDKDHNGIFSKKELKRIYNEAFSNLKNHGYFIFIRKGKTRKHPKKIKNFNAYQKSGRLVYRFYVPQENENLGSDFCIAIFDKSFYCNIKYSSKPVIIRQKKGNKPLYKIIKNKNYPVYYNPLGDPDDMRLYNKWKPGLETAYPKEIQIYFNG